MKNFKGKITAIALCAILMLSATGCMPQKNASTEPASNAAEQGVSVKSEDEMFTDRDMNPDYDESGATVITLSQDSVNISGKNVTEKNNIVTISSEGTYIVSGTLTDGQIVVDANKTDKLQIVLNGVNIASSSSAPIYIKEADKVFVTLAKDTENTLTNNTGFSADGDNNVDAVIFSKEDLTLNGYGTLSINTDCGHGIVSKDDLVITGGEYSITSSGHSLSGKDSIRVCSGAFTLNSSKDGLHSENKDDTSLGFIYVTGGDFKIVSDGDGFDSYAYLTVKGGSIDITAGGGSANAEVKRNEFDRFYNNNTSDSDDSSLSTKGIKSNGEVTVTGGTITVDSADDAIHSNTDITVGGSKMTLKTGDDGIHADEKLVITDGEISVTESYEGLEGSEIEISGGVISANASDDGINAAGGNDQSGMGGGMQYDRFSSSSGKITISGGKINVTSRGDGIDSNGSLYVSGGEIFVNGPVSGADSAIDYDGEAVITGGTVVACGSSQMAQNFGDGSTQGSIIYNVNTSCSGEIVLKDESGKTIVSFTPSDQYNSVVVSTAEITESGTYTLTMGGQDYTVEMDGYIYGSSFGGQFGGNMGGGDPGNMGGGDPGNMGGGDPGNMGGGDPGNMGGGDPGNMGRPNDMGGAPPAP